MDFRGYKMNIIRLKDILTFLNRILSYYLWIFLLVIYSDNFILLHFLLLCLQNEYTNSDRKQNCRIHLFTFNEHFRRTNGKGKYK